MRSLLVIEDPEAVEGALLGREVALGWPRRRRLEGAMMHPLVGAVLLGVGGQDPLVLNAQAHPPDIELREAMDARRGERDPVVGPDGPRPAVLTEEPIENRADALALGRQQALAAQQVARVLVRDRQRVAVDAVARAEVPFEVRGPEVIGVRRHRRYHARVRVLASTTTRPTPKDLVFWSFSGIEEGGRSTWSGAFRWGRHRRRCW